MAQHRVGIDFRADLRSYKSSLRDALKSAQVFEKTLLKGQKVMDRQVQLEKTMTTARNKELLFLRKKNDSLGKMDRAYNNLNSKVGRLNKMTGAGIPTRMSSGLGMGGIGMLSSMKGLLGSLGIGLGAYQLVSSGKKAVSNYSTTQGKETQVENMLRRPLTQTERRNFDAIAIKTGQRGDDVINSFYDALSAGFSQDQANQIANTAGRWATGGGFGIDTATSALLTAKQTYKDLSFEDISNMLAGGVLAGRTTNEQLASAMGTFVPQGKELGISLEEQLAAFAGITKVLGGRTDESATALNALYTNIMQNSDTAKKYGLTAGFVNEKGLKGLIDRINSIMDGLSIDEGVELMGDAFTNVRAKRGLAGLSADTFSTDVGLVKSGDSMEMFNRAIDDSGRQWQALMSSLKFFTDDIVESSGALGGFNDVVGWVTKKANERIAEKDFIDLQKGRMEAVYSNEGFVANAKLRIAQGSGSDFDRMMVASANAGGMTPVLESMGKEAMIGGYGKMMDFKKEVEAFQKTSVVGGMMSGFLDKMNIDTVIKQPFEGLADKITEENKPVFEKMLDMRSKEHESFMNTSLTMAELMKQAISSINPQYKIEALPFKTTQ